MGDFAKPRKKLVDVEAVERMNDKLGQDLSPINAVVAKGIDAVTPYMIKLGGGIVKSGQAIKGAYDNIAEAASLKDRREKRR